MNRVADGLPTFSIRVRSSDPLGAAAGAVYSRDSRKLAIDGIVAPLGHHGDLNDSALNAIAHAVFADVY